MIPEFGHFALISALSLALVQGIVPLLGSYLRQTNLMAVAGPAAVGQFVFMSFALGCLIWSFVTQDFSVEYVASNSNSLLPTPYRVSAVWGAHEGSLLLWGLILSFWSVLVVYRSEGLDAVFRARVIAVLGLVAVGFLAFLIGTSNPFERLLPGAVDGRDLNPLLQDIGLILHPPILYFGYVGLAVPFAFAVAALLDGKIDAAWIRWTRPWTTGAWVFLTLGIALGSWWAYYELGWGGWWFWDPVENASFMPWLVATALMHSLAVTEKRGAFKAWTVLLAISGFSLSLLGTFLVRSGVLVSVHAFASDPARGVFILIFLGVVVGGALLLFAWRAATLRSNANFALFSRETLLLVNNVLLLVASGAVLLGTLYPLFVDALGIGKISVGPPYFDAVFVPLMFPLLVIIGVGPMTRWKKDEFSRVGRRLAPYLVAGVAAGVLLVVIAASRVSIPVIAGISVSVWILLSSLLSLIDRITHKKSMVAGVFALPRAFVGMHLAHIGVAVFVVGVTCVSGYQVERDVAMKPGESRELQQYRFEFQGVRREAGPNYLAQRGTVSVYKGNEHVIDLNPEKRKYTRQSQPMTEAAIDWGLGRDVYVALGEPLGDGGWAVRLYLKPFIRWIWLGPLLMAIGGLLAATDKRYKRRVGKTATAGAISGAPTGSGLAST